MQIVFDGGSRGNPGQGYGSFVILAQLLRLDGEKWWQGSKLMPYGEGVANGLRAIVGEQLERHG